MDELKRYRRRKNATVVAVQIDLETDGFTYQKWGDVQVARAGDWLVNNNGSVYTIDSRVFERTYSEISLGLYEKTTLTWARVAKSDGQVKSTSGFTNYQAGDMIAFNSTDENDGWAMSPKEFERLYEPDE